MLATNMSCLRSEVICIKLFWSNEPDTGQSYGLCGKPAHDIVTQRWTPSTDGVELNTPSSMKIMTIINNYTEIRTEGNRIESNHSPDDPGERMGTLDCVEYKLLLDGGYLFSRGDRSDCVVRLLKRSAKTKYVIQRSLFYHRHTREKLQRAVINNLINENVNDTDAVIYTKGSILGHQSSA